MSEFEFKYKIIIKMIRKLISKKGTYVDIQQLNDIIDLFEDDKAQEKKEDKK